MRKAAIYFIISCSIGILTGCPIFQRSEPVASAVTNIGDLNSQYDDYNAYAPSLIDESFHVIYSTNRGSAGTHFDVWKGTIVLEQDSRDLVITSEAVGPFLDQYDSLGDELGPLLYSPISASGAIFSDQLTHPESAPLYFFARGEEGDGYDIYYTAYDGSIATPIPLGVNSLSNEAYITFSAEFFFFATNRDESWDIYRAPYGAASVESDLTAGDVSEPDPALNSAKADTCPYVYTHWFTEVEVIVFASDRDGGRGGYDIYYALFNEDEGTWNDPQSIGESINTEYNEYRPTLYCAFTLEPFHWILLFSSDRPGGKGGYDLYLAVFDEFPFD